MKFRWTFLSFFDDSNLDNRFVCHIYLVHISNPIRPTKIHIKIIRKYNVKYNIVMPRKIVFHYIYL